MSGGWADVDGNRDVFIIVNTAVVILV